MKFNFTVEIDQCDDICSLQDEIIWKTAEILLNQVMGSSYYDRTEFSEKLEKLVIKKLESLMDTDFKGEVAQRVTENLANKFERTNQYKTLKADGEVIADSLIKTGLKDLVGEIVKSEMKKVFNQ